MMKIGFIGTGNMGGALASAAARSGEVEVLLANRTKAKAETLAERIGAVVSRNEIIAREADHIFLGVKPQMLPEVLDPIKDAIHPDKLVVTIAAGKGFSFYASYFGENVPLVRVMPNICAQVLCSASAVCPNAACRPEQVELVRAMFRSVGEVYDIPEAQFSAFSALGGASGAFVQMYIDALSSAGVKAGLSRALAQKIACQATLGAAKLCQETGEHPMALVDKVTSPGGTTIEGVHALKKAGFESAVIEAVNAVIEKDKRLG